MTLLITEGIVRTLDIKEVHCAFIETDFFKNYNMFEKQDMCEKYNSLKYDYTQQIRLLEPNQHNKYFNINSDGFRGPELNFQDEDYIIFVIGGSTTFGFITSSDEFTIPSILGKKINDEELNVEVVNAGISMATSGNELYYLENYILDYSPDMVIMYDGWNDIIQGITDYKKNNSDNDYNPISEDLSNEDNTNTGLISFFAKIDYQTGLGIALFLSHLINDPEIDLNKNINIYKNMDTPALDFIESKIENNWSKTCLIGEKHELQIINILQPMLGTSDRIISDEAKSLLTPFSVHMKKLDLDENQLNACHNVYDFRNIFAGMNNEVIYFDEGHMSDFGNEIIAENIFKKILPIILKDLN
jgi:lysophospholipase L1-like esterase